jgi:hypothetical protein
MTGMTWLGGLRRTPAQITPPMTMQIIQGEHPVNFLMQAIGCP